MKLKKLHIKKHENDIHIHMPMPPSFSVDNSVMPEIKDWQVGETYRLVIDVRQTSKSEMVMHDKEVIDGRMEIVAYKYLPKKSVEEMSDKEFEEYQGEVLSKGKM